MRPVLLVAQREFLDGSRNRWIQAITLLMAAMALTLAFLGSAPTGRVGAGAVAVTVVSLSSLTIFLVPLIALLLSYDTLVGEFERGTMPLLLTYPLTRAQILFGKFLGQLAILAVATVLGYGCAGVGLAATAGNEGDWGAFAAMIGSSVLLGAVFLALGILISAAASNRGAAGGAAIGVWLGFVLLFDMGLLGALATDQGRNLTSAVVNLLLLLNPTDVFRLLNLAGFEGVAAVAGMTGAGLSPVILTAALIAWTLLPLVLAAFLFRRRQV